MIGLLVTKRVSNLLGAILLVIGLASGSAFAADGFTTADVNMRAGPGPQYPIVATVPAGAGVTIHGCVRGWRWCDISWRGIRGWVSARFLSTVYRDRRVLVPAYGVAIGVPVVGFGFDYWEEHYRDHPWYRDRHRWFDRDHWRDWRERERLRDRRERLRDRRERLRDRRDREGPRDRVRVDDRRDDRREGRGDRERLRDRRDREDGSRCRVPGQCR